VIAVSNVADAKPAQTPIWKRSCIRTVVVSGIVSSTDAMRLRHTYELITHFSQLEINESDTEGIDEAEAIASLKSCIRGVLGRPKIEVAKKFIEFRETLEGETLSADYSRVKMLNGSPYFFYKLTLNVLMNAAKKNIGAQLEHALANANAIIPSIWGNLRETEKWQIGQTYAEVYSDGKTSSVGGLKSVLLKVKGFDYVPENLRSETFILAAEAVIKAHEGLNNIYNEPAPVRKLAKLGTTIPVPVLPACITALLSVILGNFYGISWSAVPIAKAMLKKLSADRWDYYLNNVFPSDIKILDKLSDDKPRTNWIQIANEFGFSDIDIRNNTVKSIVKASLKQNSSSVSNFSNKLINQYYGK
jgi:energy-converting hydrogenase Eha subunit A